MKIKSHTQEEMIKAFEKYGIPKDIISEAMRLLCWGAKVVNLIY